MTAIPDLSPAERQLVKAAASGTPVDFRRGVPGLDDPGGADGWGAERTVRAEILARLLCQPSDFGHDRVRAVKLYGARIAGELDLEAASVTCPLLFGGCLFDGQVILADAQAVVIRLPGCHVQRIAADQLSTRGDLALNDGFTASGEICLAGAAISGQLVLDGARLSNPGGKALSASWITVGQSLLCRDRFTARGQVDLQGARIGGMLGMDSARIVNPKNVALDARRMTVQGAMLCRGLKVRGELRLFGARIGGQLNFDKAQLKNQKGRPALYASQLKVENTMFCRNGFTTRGEIILDGARIGGRFNLSGARLENPGGRTLAAERLTTGQGMYCRRQFMSSGEIALVDASIGGRCDFTDARLDNRAGYALYAPGLSVARDAVFTGAFAAEGEVHLPDAQIGGRLDFEGASLANPAGRALNLEGARASVLSLLPKKSPEGLVDLASARVASFRDDPRSWPSRLRLRGFAYDTLDGKAPVRDRLSWLSRNDGGYLPEIYDQLADCYRRAGRPEDARLVAIAKQRQRRSQLNSAARAWNRLLYVTVGYGYRTWLAGIWLAALVAAGTAVFAAAYPAHMHKSAAVVPAFNPFVYALDTVLPVVDLGEQKAWVAQGAAQTAEWLLICAGWILTTAVVAGVTNALNRRT